MPFPASNGALSDVLEETCRFAVAMKQHAERASAKAAAGNVTSTDIIDLDIRLRQWRATLAEAGATPGIGAYAQEQLGDGTLDVAAEFNAMLGAIDNVTGWIRANFPVGSGQAAGYLLARTWGPDGPVDRLFSPTQTAGLRTQLDALAATVV